VDVGSAHRDLEGALHRATINRPRGIGLHRKLEPGRSRLAGAVPPPVAQELESDGGERCVAVLVDAAFAGGVRRRRGLDGCAGACARNRCRQS
jgi:hypothetical protein